MDSDEELDDFDDVEPVFSMNALLGLFKIKLNKADFEFQGSKYRIEFGWTDGLKQIGKDGQNNIQDVAGNNIKDNSNDGKQEIRKDTEFIDPLFDEYSRRSQSSKGSLVSKKTEIRRNSSGKDDLEMSLIKLRGILNENSLNTSLIFLFASPIVVSFASKASINLPQLNFNKEFEVIEKALEESRIQINYQRTVATLDNLPDVLIRNPFVLHFSGHGVKNNIESIGSEAAIRTGEGDMLLFEDSK